MGNDTGAADNTAAEPQRSIVWVRRRGMVVKVVEGADPAEIARITALALGAADRLSPARIEEVPSIADRIAQLLTATGPLTGRQLADQLNVTQDAIRKALQRGAGTRFAMHASDDGPAVWAVHEDVGARYQASIDGTL